MEVLFSDTNIAACVKPVGVESEIQMPQLLKAQLGGDIFPLHRLDKNVGGLMVYARSKAAAAKLSGVIARGEMVKEYVAAVHGSPPEQGDWEDLLFKDSRTTTVFVVQKLRSGVKQARLAFRNLLPGENSLVQVRLYTGRSHQIRVQFSSRGFPLVGDHKYGSRAKETEPMLWSCRITFPYEGKPVSYCCMPDWAGDIQPEDIP